MRLEEIGFSEYYREYIAIEANELTDRCKGVKVHEDDCYALCSSYVDEEGLTQFNILSIGSSWEKCTRGLGRKYMLGTFSIADAFQCEARIVDPSEEMIQKNEPFMKSVEQNIDEDIIAVRSDPRLDSLRDVFYPDIVLTGVLVNRTITEYEMKITGVEGPFLKGTLAEDPKYLTIHMDDPMWALPYVVNGECRLFALFAGSQLSDEEKESLHAIMNEMEEYGLRFTGFSIKN